MRDLGILDLQPKAGHPGDFDDPGFFPQVGYDEIIPGEQATDQDGDNQRKYPDQPPRPPILADDNVDVENEEQVDRP
jgi:hypothetical protein